METLINLSMTELEAGFETIRQAPKDHGIVRMIVRRPGDDEREVVETGELDLQQGLIGDNWKLRGSKHTPDGSANINAQLTLMNARVIELIAQTEDRWPQAGDQFYVDLDLSQENLPAGTRLAMGSVIIEVSAEPHTGCRKFSARFGSDAMRFVNSPEGKQLRLRGINAKIIQAGEIKVGDTINKV